MQSVKKCQVLLSIVNQFLKCLSCVLLNIVIHIFSIFFFSKKVPDLNVTVLIKT